MGGRSGPLSYEQSRSCARPSMFQEPHQLLTVREAAEVLRQSEWSVREKIKRGELPSIRVGVGPRGPLRIPRAELERWLYGPPAAVGSRGAASPLARSSRGALKPEDNAA